MNFYNAFSILIVLCALFAYINYRFLKLPSAIGLMFIALLTSLGLLFLGKIDPAITNPVAEMLRKFDFTELLLGYMLNFLLFASAIQVNIDELKKEKVAVILFSTIGVVISAFLIGIAMFYLLPLFSISMPLLHCLMFGALISPTDPVAVISVLKRSNVSKSLETKIAGESLFNDGVSVVLFITLLRLNAPGNTIKWDGVLLLFAREAIGGVLVGTALGWVTIFFIKRVEDYKIEVLLTVALVMGGYLLTHYLDVSGPLGMVFAGIIVGNKGKRTAMSDITKEYIDKFWELIDEILNAILFVLIGLELLLLNFLMNYIEIGFITILVMIIARYVSLYLPSRAVGFKEKISHKTLMILTWGGLRGGISIALALVLPVEVGKDLWISLTYFIVAFSILVQGLTIEKVSKQIL